MNNLKPLVTTKKQQSPIGRSIFLLSGFVGLAFPVLSSGEVQTTNTGYGSLALYYIETGYGSGVNNSAFGKDALFGDLDGSNNTGVGYSALSNNRTGYSNVANGWSALYSNTVGAHNTATGNEALYTNTADFNTADGRGRFTPIQPARLAPRAAMPHCTTTLAAATTPRWVLGL